MIGHELRIVFLKLGDEVCTSRQRGIEALGEKKVLVYVRGVLEDQTIGFEGDDSVRRCVGFALFSFLF